MKEIIELKEVSYGELFCLLADQEQAMTSAKQLLAGHGELLPGYHAMVVLYPDATSRQCDLPIPEEPS